MHTVISEHPILCWFGSNNTQRKSYQCCLPFTDLQRITASLRLSEAERNERGETQFLCRKYHVSRFSCGGLGRDPTTFITTVFCAILHLFFWVLARHAAAQPTRPICICFLLQEKITVCIQFIVFVNFSV